MSAFRLARNRRGHFMRNIIFVSFAAILLTACQNSAPVNSQAPKAPEADIVATLPVDPPVHWQSNYRSIQSIPAQAVDNANKKFSSRIKRFTSDRLIPDVSVTTISDLNKDGYFKASHLAPENQVLRLQATGHFSQNVPGQNNQMIVLEYSRATAIFIPQTGEMLALNLR